MGILSTKSESIDASRRVRTKITTTPAAAATTTITTIPAKSKVSVKNCVIFCSLLNRPKRRQDFDGHKEMNEKHHHNKITAFKKKGGKKGENLGWFRINQTKQRIASIFYHRWWSGNHWVAFPKRNGTNRIPNYQADRLKRYLWPERGDWSSTF